MTTIKSVTAAQMQEIDKRTTEEFGIPSLILMENAGRLVAEKAKILKPSKVAVLCGSGNNGGDGLVAARYLSGYGFKVEILLIKPQTAFKGDALMNFNIADKLGIPFYNYGAHISLKYYDLIIDALLGTGTKGEVSGKYRNAIEEINASGKTVLSVDIPSGLDSDTGEKLGAAVKADITVTMAVPKKGLLEKTAAENTGKLIIADIGIPKILIGKYFK